MHTPDQSPTPELPTARPLGAGPLPTTWPPADAFVEPRRADPLAIAQRKWVVAIELVVVFALFVSVVAVAPPVMNTAAAPGDEEIRRVNVAVVLLTGGIAVSLVLVVLRKNRQPLSTIGVGSRNLIADVAIGLGTCVFLFALTFTMRLFLTLVDPSMFEVLTENFERLQRILPRMGPLTILVTAATVGVYEEVLFRGFLLPRLRHLCGSWVIAVTVASFFFAVLHVYQGGLGIMTIFFVALTLSLVFVWRQSLLPVTLAHFLFDLASLLALQWMRKHPELLPTNAFGSAWIVSG